MLGCGGRCQLDLTELQDVPQHSRGRGWMWTRPLSHAPFGRSVEITVLAGGTGAAKFLRGLSALVGQESLRVIVNTGDDFELHGLYISPDVDTVTYALAGMLSRDRGWGVEGDSWDFLEALGRIGGETWFRLGDRDLATHVRRTTLLRRGQPLSRVAEAIASSLGVRARVLPMTDDRVGTWLDTALGPIPFQEYFVKHGSQVEVQAVHYGGTSSAKPGPGVPEAIAFADLIIVAPSNPVTSIGPILAVPGIRDELGEARAPVVAVSPIVGLRAVTGPAHRLMAAAGMEPSIRGLAKAYRDFIDGLIVEEGEDPALLEDISQLGLRVLQAPTLMVDDSSAIGLAKTVVAFAEKLHR